MTHPMQPQRQAPGDLGPRAQEESEFLELCKAHDLTFEYSDDGSVWRRGRASLDNVRAAAKQLPPDVAARIWNSVVDMKLIDGYRQGYYWKVPPT